MRRAAGAHAQPPEPAPCSPLPARDRWSKLDCSWSTSVTKHTGVLPGPLRKDPLTHTASTSDGPVEPTAAGHHGCWPPAVFHAEIAGAMDCQTQEGLPLPQTRDQVDSQTWQVYLSGSGQTPGQCSPASLKLPFGCCLCVLLCLCPLTRGSMQWSVLFLQTPQAASDVRKACLGSLFKTAASRAPPENCQGPGPRNLH